FYYVPDICNLPAIGAWPALPKGLEAGVEAGLVDPKDGIAFTLAKIAARKHGKPAPQWNRSYKGWSIFHKPQSNPRGKDSQRQKVAESHKPDPNDGYRGLKHHPSLSNPEYYEDSRRNWAWFKSDFWNQISKILESCDLDLISDYRHKHAVSLKAWKGCRDQKELAVKATEELTKSKEYLSKAWDILEIYVKAWQPQLVKLPPGVLQQIQQREAKRRDAAEERRQVQRKPQGNVPRQFAEQQGSCGYDPVPKDQQKWSSLETWDGKHPTVPPESDAEAAAQVKDWAEHQRSVVDPSMHDVGLELLKQKSNAATDYLLQQLGEADALRCKRGDMTVEEKAERQQKFEAILQNLLENILSQTADLTSTIRNEADVGLAKVDVAYFYQLVNRMTKKHTGYEAAVLEEMKRAYDSDVLALITKMLTDNNDMAKEHAQALLGAFLPQRWCSEDKKEEPEIPRLVWSMAVETEAARNYLAIENSS
ncbi:hypothetical protein A1O7_06729, partial [Cladophialophora yegresii CBS 114405]